jgi:hypothetical protein
VDVERLIGEEPSESSAEVRALVEGGLGPAELGMLQGREYVPF